MRKPFLFNLFLRILILIIGIAILFPFLWMFISSLKIHTDSIWWLHFHVVFTEHNFARYFVNSIIVSFSAVMLSLIIGLPAAYSIVRFRQKRLLILILAAWLIPGISFLMPWRMVFASFNVLYTHSALIFSHLFITLPVVVWIMAAYFKTIPIELEDSARVDGATRQRAFVSIILPLSMPGVITAAALGFIFSWNNFMFAQVLGTEKTRTLPVALYNFTLSAAPDWSQVISAAVLMVTPAILLAVLFRKYLIKGLTVGAVKG